MPIFGCLLTPLYRSYTRSLSLLRLRRILLSKFFWLHQGFLGAIIRATTYFSTLEIDCMELLKLNMLYSILDNNQGHQRFGEIDFHNRPCKMTLLDPGRCSIQNCFDGIFPKTILLGAQKPHPHRHLSTIAFEGSKLSTQR